MFLLYNIDLHNLPYMYTACSAARHIHRRAHTHPRTHAHTQKQYGNKTKQQQKLIAAAIFVRTEQSLKKLYQFSRWAFAPADISLPLCFDAFLLPFYLTLILSFLFIFQSPLQVSPSFTDTPGFGRQVKATLVTRAGTNAFIANL